MEDGDLNSFFFPHGPILQRMWKNHRVLTKKKKKEKRSYFQCCWHIFISIAISWGSYKILSFHLEQVLVGSLCNRLMALKLEWNI